MWIEGRESYQGLATYTASLASFGGSDVPVYYIYYTIVLNICQPLVTSKQNL